MAAERLGGEWRAERAGKGRGAGRPPGLLSPLATWLKLVLVFHFVCGGWVLFNSEDLGHAIDIYLRLIQGWGSGPELLTPMIAVVITGSILAQLTPVSLARRWTTGLSSAPAGVIAAGFAVWTMIVVALGPEGVADYIYFQF